MQLEITATGEALRYIDANAQALGIVDPDRIGPDPVAIFCRFVSLGFADLADAAAGPASATVQSSSFDADRLVQQWTLQVQGFDQALLRVVSNLLRAMGARSVSFRSLEGDASAALPAVAAHAERPYPTVAPPAGVELDYAEPDAQDIVRGRRLELSLRQPPSTEVLHRLCGELDVWMELVCRSGYCPPEAEPAQAGAMPAFAHASGPQSVTVEFDGFFRVDEACFAAIASYAHRLARQGLDVASIAIE